MGEKMRFKLLACEILFRECCFVVSQASHRLDIEFLPKGLHDVGRENMSRRLAQAIDATEKAAAAESYDAILLGYALCSGGIVGLKSHSIPLVVPRAHDCITLLLGSRERYQECFLAHPGTYFKSPGWIERAEGLNQCLPDSMVEKFGLNLTESELIRRYGEENGRFLAENLRGMRHYSQLTYIETGIEPNQDFERHAQIQAAEQNLAFEKMVGDLSLLQCLVGGQWDSNDFLVVLPGQRIAFSYDEAIICAVDDGNHSIT